MLVAPGLGAQGPASADRSLPVTVPVERSGSTLFVPVRIAGSEPRWFILDTGANVCVIDGAGAARMGLPLDTMETRGQGAGAGGVRVRWIADAARVRLEVPGLAFTCERIAVIDLSGTPGITGRPVDGILGYSFFAPYVVEVDYDAEVLRLHDPASYVYSGGGDTVALTFRRNLPYVTARIAAGGAAPRDRELLLDTGSEDAVDDSLVLHAADRREVTGGVGLGQEYRATLGRLDSVAIGPFTFRQVPGVAPGVALVGGEVLRRFRLVLDYGRGRMYLEPNEHLHDSFNALPFGGGLELRWDAAAAGARVHEVRPGSPGEAAGLRVGDLIVAVDGLPVAELGLRRLVRLLRLPGRTFRLRLQREGQMQEVDLRIPGVASTPGAPASARGANEFAAGKARNPPARIGWARFPMTRGPPGRASRSFGRRQGSRRPRGSRGASLGMITRCRESS
ncbi:MAG TPA: aspartyl protease family protein [Longimicrobium sp.]|nr:aspartyl protease family protein [Longimicrobium sp.]